MKVMLDTNVFISYLLAPGEKRTITQVVEACLSADIELLVPPELLEEITENVEFSPYLHARIPHAEVENLTTLLAVMATIPSYLEEEIPSYVRDPDDDYLVAYGLVHDVAYLVTGDPDLLVLRQVGNMRIVRPRDFLEVLRE